MRQSSLGMTFIYRITTNEALPPVHEPAADTVFGDRDAGSVNVKANVAIAHAGDELDRYRGFRGPGAWRRPGWRHHDGVA